MVSKMERLSERLSNETVSAPAMLASADADWSQAPLLRLCHNENAYGPSPRVRALLDALDHTALSRYPDPGNEPLVRMLAERWDLAPAEIVVGSGSSELIDVVCKLRGIGGRVLLSEPAFVWYRQVSSMLQLTMDGVFLRGNPQADVESLIAACTEQTTLAFVSNPNNPTGSYLPAEQLRQLVAKVPPHVCLVVDEAYAEYADAPDFVSALELRGEREHLVVLRTFSKAYGLAGLRVGWAVADRQTAAQIRATRSPYSLHCFATTLACEAMRDEQYVRDCAERNARERQRLAAALTKLGVRVRPTQGNFFLADFGIPSRTAHEQLARRRIQARMVPESDQWLRITVGTEQDNDEFITRLASAPLRREDAIEWEWR
jgi:histidinol-phosphate aminotransferase